MALEDAGLRAIAAGIAIAGGAIGAGIGESQIGTAAIAAVSENEKMFGTALLFTVIPETLAIFGLVIAIMVQIM